MVDDEPLPVRAPPVLREVVGLLPLAQDPVGGTSLARQDGGADT
jgi:hypothetical protein